MAQKLRPWYGLVIKVELTPGRAEKKMPTVVVYELKHRLTAFIFMLPDELQTSLKTTQLNCDDLTGWQPETKLEKLDVTRVRTTMSMF